MHVSALEGPKGEAVFKVGGPLSFKTDTFKGWNISLEWARSGRKTIRVLCIWPEAGVGVGIAVKPGIWTIAASAVVEMLDFDKDDISTGKPSDFLIEEAGLALPMLGKDQNDKQALFSLVDCVLRYAPELGHMPVTPIAIEKLLDGKPMWDMQQVKKTTGEVKREDAV